MRAGNKGGLSPKAHAASPSSRDATRPSPVVDVQVEHLTFPLQLEPILTPQCKQAEYPSPKKLCLYFENMKAV